MKSQISPNPCKIEACVDSLQRAILAEQKGADRIELCSRLDLGGTTPAYDLIRKVRQNIRIPIHVMIRPRGGSFSYSSSEIECMRHQIGQVRKMNVQGIVLGVLNADNEIDSASLKTLIEVCGDLAICFHKAIDEVPGLQFAIDQLSEIGNIQYVLTSGKAPKASIGIPTIRQMIKWARGRLEIMAAGKITRENLSEIHKEIGGTWYHGRQIV